MLNKRINFIYGVIGLAVLAVPVWYVIWDMGIRPQSDKGSTPPLANLTVVEDIVNQLDILPNEALIANVPFTSQAPTFDWADPRQQDACEEVAVLMAAKWVTGEQIGTAEQAVADIITLAKLSENMFGTYVDSSAVDTLKMFQKYTGTTNGTVKYDVTLVDMKSELASGHILLAPMDGKALHNPNYTAGGPERHFLVIIGYDDNTKMFTTNDSGTRKGKNYRYKYDVLYAAMRDYPTGDHKAIASNVPAMIIVSK